MIRENLSPYLIYMLHFEPKLKHAQHYVGITKRHRLERRLEEHARGSGSAIVRAAVNAGCRLFLVKTFAAEGFEDERAFKRKTNNRATCPICAGDLFLHSVEVCEIFRARCPDQTSFAVTSWPQRLPSVPFNNRKRPATAR